TPLASVTANGSGSAVVLMNVDIMTTGNQIYLIPLIVSGFGSDPLVKLTGANFLFGRSVRGGSTLDSLKVEATGDITFDGPVGVTFPMNRLTLEPGGAVTQAAPLIGDSIELLGAGNFTLTDPGNNFAALAGLTTGAVQYNDVDALTIGVVN